jgi:hypothetical protein
VNACDGNGLREPGSGGDGVGVGDEPVGEGAAGEGEAGADEDEDPGRGMAGDVGDGVAEDTGDADLPGGLPEAEARAELNAEADCDEGDEA